MTLATTQSFHAFGWALLPLVIVGIPVCALWLFHYSRRAAVLRWVLLIQCGLGTLVSFLAGFTRLVTAPQRGRNDYYQFLWTLTWVCVGSFVCSGVYNRREWARRVLVILNGAEFVSTLFAALLLGFAARDAGFAATMVGVALYGGVMWYLLSSPEVKLEFSA
jgi:hypothetical protein